MNLFLCLLSWFLSNKLDVHAVVGGLLEEGREVAVGKFDVAVKVEELEPSDAEALFKEFFGGFFLDGGVFKVEFFPLEVLEVANCLFYCVCFERDKIAKF